MAAGPGDSELDDEPLARGFGLCVRVTKDLWIAPAGSKGIRYAMRSHPVTWQNYACFQCLRAFEGCGTVHESLRRMATSTRFLGRMLVVALVVGGVAACGDPTADEAVDNSNDQLLEGASIQRAYENAKPEDFEDTTHEELLDTGGFFDDTDAERDVELVRQTALVPVDGGSYSQERIYVWRSSSAKIWKASSKKSYYILQAFYRDANRAITQIYRKSDDDDLNGKRILSALETMDGKLEWLPPARLDTFAERPADEIRYPKPGRMRY